MAEIEFQTKFEQGVGAREEVAPTHQSQNTLKYRGAGLSLLNRPIQAPIYTPQSSGWSLKPNGDAEFNGNKLTSTHFTKVLSLKGVSLYVSDGTTPNGNLSGTAGDICLNGPSGQPFFCAGTTTWTGM